MERWKQINGYDKYWISDRGNVKSTSAYKNGKYLKPQRISQLGYNSVRLYKGSQIYKHHYIHRLVAEYFIRPILEGEVVHHIDENIFNNYYSNLQIMPHSEHSAFHNALLGDKNMRYSVDDVKAMRALHKECGNVAEVARRYNMPYSSAYKIINKISRGSI